MRLALTEDWKPTGGLGRGTEGLGHTSFRISQVSPTQILIMCPVTLGAESLQFVMITGAVTWEQVGVSMLRTRMGKMLFLGSVSLGFYAKDQVNTAFIVYHKFGYVVCHFC